jgi:sulfotransferase 6B1
MNWRKNILIKKSFRYGMSLPRRISSLCSTRQDYLDHPTIFINSFPKSGTHLLLQVLLSMPGTKDWGLFLASTPSFTFNEITPERLSKKILTVSPGEIVTSHMYWDQSLVTALSEIHSLNFFIYRDPRDVVISEAYYLTNMNRWHKMHKIFSNLTSDTERFQMSIEGIKQNTDIDYPNIYERFIRYKNWIEDDNTFSIKFEDLRDKDSQRDTVKKIVSYYLSHFKEEIFDVDELTDKAMKAINPNNSHTFRSGEVCQWKRLLTKSQIETLKDITGDLLIELGYEQDYKW